MAYEQFKETKFRAPSLALIASCDDIITSYLADGMRLTLRQLYYQLVSANIVPNTERSYKNVGTLVSNARLAGMLDWDGIEDRGRQPAVPPEFDSVEDLLDAAFASYRLPRLAGQSEYAELWVEKDALSGVLRPIAREYHVPLMVNKGYSSQSAMFSAAGRIRAACEKLDDDPYRPHTATVLYLGDMDPSGEDMVRDIQDRLEMFLNARIGEYGYDAMREVDVDVEKVALNMDQVKQFGLPPNPAKLSDSRAAAFITKYGRESWVVDALPPRELQRIAREAIEGCLDLDLMEEIKEQEEADKDKLREALDQ